MKNICVFCGSNNGNRKAYTSAAQEMGLALSNRKIRLVYGGGKVGIMGILADAVLEAGGQVTGVITRALFDMETGKNELDDLRIVDTMHERKAMMASLSDGFIALPGGFGTFEELFEALTWLQLGIHHNPVGLLNVDGYYDHLLEFLRSTSEQGFVREQHLRMLLVDENPEDLLDKMAAFQYQTVSKV
ncbi:MAG: TIGR00730 family Rossman fold protein [Anaerolineaceae bacterium]|nr:TIGR00730 family Rossman fold protein [Anaerolineaceae bacterium]